MKIVILTVEHLYSNKVIKDLLNAYPNDIRLIIEPTEQLRGKTAFQAVLHYLKIAGLYYVFYQSFRLILYKIISLFYGFVGQNVENKFFPYKKLVKKLGTKTQRVSDINSKESISLLREIKPDIIISALFSQIIKREVINIPKLGVINLHPAYLPNYKGINPTFWAMANGEKYSGATIHYIDNDIDTGPIIERIKILIDQSDTEDKLYWKCVNLGSKLLIKSIAKIYQKKDTTIKNSGGSYFSFPTKKAVKRFQKLKRKFYNFADLLN